MLYNYHENIKTPNPQRNARSVYSETVHLNEPSGCDVTTMQSPPPQHIEVPSQACQI